jgi:hypothetical protein
MKKALILIVLLSFTLNDIFAAQRLYISPTGNDKNNGTKEQPLASLAGARDRVRQLRDQRILDDTVFVQVLPGDYYMSEPLRLGPDDGGTDQSPVIFTADADNRPVFYGGMKLDKFEEVNKNLWRVFVPEVARYGFYFEQMYINGERRFRARTPNPGNFYMVRRMEEIPIDKEGGIMQRRSGEVRWAAFASQKIILHPSDASVLDILKTDNADDILAVFHHSWSARRQFIRHIDQADTAFYITGGGLRPWLPIDHRTRFYIENFREALDAPGEWFLSRDGYLYYIPLPGETIANTECMVPIIDKFIVITGDENKGNNVSHIRFENLRFRVAGYKTPFRGNASTQAASPVEATVMVDFADHIEFYNCEIANTGLYGIWFRRDCFKSSVIRCHLHDLGAGGIKIGDTQLNPDQSTEVTNHITVRNNIIQHGGYVFASGVGVIIFNASDNVITHNDIANFRYSGVSVGWRWGYAFSPSKRNKIEFNHIHHLGWGELDDIGGVYTLGPSEGTTVSNNVIHNVYSYRYGGWGLYTDEGSTGIVMENNLVYKCKDAGFHQHFGKENILRNNIFAFSEKSAIEVSRVEEHLSYTFTNNIIYQENGGIISDVWGGDNGTKIKVDLDRNCYWIAGEPSPEFYGLSFAEWQKLGRDRNSIVADPLFIDPQNLDFRFRRTRVARKIGFTPFDYSKAGVYGDPEWINLARLDPALIEEFDKAVAKNRWTGE